MLLSAECASAAPEIHCTGGIFAPPSPRVTPFVAELRRMPKKEPLPGGATDLALKQNGGVAPNGTVYPQVTGDDALTTYRNSLERIVAPQQKNSGKTPEFPPRWFYVLRAQEAFHDFHPEMTALTVGKKGTIIWGYDGMFPGPTFKSKYGEPILVRVINELYDLYFDENRKRRTRDIPGGFGNPQISTHLHNGHTASESDGNPVDIYPPTSVPPPFPQFPQSILQLKFRDHHYAMFRAGLDPRDNADPHKPPNKTDGEKAETLSTLWYHDHSMHYTAENVYKGLVGFHLFFDEVDSDNEKDANQQALKLPSGDFDVPLLIQDKRFTADGQLFLPPENSIPSPINGVLGDRFTVNGQIQPKLAVRRRKYRFRLLNAGPSRFYQLFLTRDLEQLLNKPTLTLASLDQSFLQIGNDESLLTQPEQVTSVLLSVSERADVVIDFSRYARGDKLYLVNRLVMQDDGSGPRIEFDNVVPPEGPHFMRYTNLAAGHGDPILRFDVGDDGPDSPPVPRKLQDNPSLPASIKDSKGNLLRPDALKKLPNHRRFKLSVFKGIWMVNNRPFDPSPAGGRPLNLNAKDLNVSHIGCLETPRRVLPGEEPDGEVWTFSNPVSTWAHPVHIHMEEFQILWRNGQPPPATERCKKDVLRLDPLEEVQVFIRFRDFLGKYPIHCHNVFHEDHQMMLRFDVVGDY